MELYRTVRCIRRRHSLPGHDGFESQQLSRQQSMVSSTSVITRGVKNPQQPTRVLVENKNALRRAELKFQTESNRIISIHCRQNGQKRKSTIQVQTNEHLQRKIAISGKDGHMKLTTYHGYDVGYDGSQEPNETLVSGERHISGKRAPRPGRSINSPPVSTEGAPYRARWICGSAGESSQIT
jgi:hypothetical protein